MDKNTEVKKDYKYKFIQFSVSDDQKELIEKWTENSNYNTTSDFVRTVVFDFIRNKEHPELKSNNSQKGLIERMIEIGKTQIKLQEKTLERINIFEEMKRDLELIKKYSDHIDFTVEAEAIYNLLKSHNCLTLKQIVEKTGLDKDISLQVLSNDNRFKLNMNGKWCLNGE